MMTLREVILDTMGRFEDGDDSIANLRDVLLVLRRKAPRELLDEPMPDCVTTERSKV